MIKDGSRASPTKADQSKKIGDNVRFELLGFQRWDDILQVRLFAAERATTPTPPGHPRWILIYGWGDALPKHIQKYCDKYSELFPQSPQILVTCGIDKVSYEPRIERRAELVQRLVTEVFGDGGGNGEALDQSNVLVHCMSNMGGIYYASTLFAFARQYNRPMPHTLLVMDSTPGGTKHTARNIMLWGGASALKIARNTRVPFFLANIYSSLRFVSARLCSFWVGEDPPGAWSRKAMNSADYISPDKTRFLYLYGKDDALIRATDIESHLTESRERGWGVDIESFDGTPHVGHMREYPERYWGAIRDSWNQAVVQRSRQQNGVSKL